MERLLEYWKTLRVYLLLERSLIMTPVSLHIHRNTLVKRIQRMQEILQLNLDNAQLRAQILLLYLTEEGALSFEGTEFERMMRGLLSHFKNQARETIVSRTC